MMRRLMLVFAIATMSACRPAPSSDPATQAVPAPTSSPEADTATRAAPSGIAADVDAPAFVDKVWRVQSSSAGEPGSTYAFLADGTLVIDAPHGTPMRGQWRYDGGKLVMIEEGVAYPTDIVKLDATTFQLRSHNPGGAVDIALVVAPDVPLPTSASASVETPAPGSDRDSHGCIPSAGYSWCARTNQCERPWELAKANGFENSREGFDKFCGTPAK